MNCKVFIESSVLISASVYAVYKELDVPLKHHFYDISIPLFDFLKANVRDRLGITTATVEEESRSVLADAVLDEIEKVSEAPEKRDLLFQLYSAFCNICSDNLSKNSSILLREPIPESERFNIYLEVEEMYTDITESFDIRERAKEMAKLVPKRFKKTAENIYWEQMKPTLQPLRCPPSMSDKKILAEAVYLLRDYRKKLPNFKLYLSSTDHHFSPSFDHRVRTASHRILQRFDVICDWPNIILEQVKKDLKK